MTTPIPLFGLGISAKSPAVTAKLLTNIYCEQRPQGEKSQMVGYGTPGLAFFATFGETKPRGGIEFPKSNVAFVVHRDLLWEVNNAGSATSRGSLLTVAGRVTMAHNGVEVMIVDGIYGYTYNTVSHVFAQIIHEGFPALPSTCAYLSRRFLVGTSGSSRFSWSDIDDGTSWPALNFGNAETNPDPVVTVYASNGQAVLLGTETTEFWGNSGTADPAFVPLQGTASEWGLAAVYSVAKYENSFACLMKNRMGQVMVAQMSGYLPKKLSTLDVDAIINSYPVVSDASAYSYMLGGHLMYVISFPTVGYTWLFDGSTGIWSRLRSTGTTRHLGEFSFNLGGRTIVADYAQGNLYTLTDTVFTDNGVAIEREIIGETIAAQGEELLSVDCLRLDMETGVGLPTGLGSNPQVSLSVSRDNGRTWGPDMWRSVGKAGEYTARIEWRRLGTCRAFTPRIRMSDPVKAVFVRAGINPET